MKQCLPHPSFIISLLVLASGAVVSADWQYGIMVDAGSGGTRLHVYRWPPRVADPLRPLYAAVTVPEEMFEVSARPGISSFANNITGLKPYMNDLLDRAASRLQDRSQSWYLMPLYLKATAGARDLYQDQRDAIFAELRSVLFSSNFRFDDEYWARTISGEEEAVHAWLSVNAIKGTYRAVPENTWGALDMGGASTQIVFIPKDVSIIQNYFPLHISYLHLHLYSHSFLEYGYRDANMRMVKMLARVQGVSGSQEYPVRNPCMPSDSLVMQPFTETFAPSSTPVLWVQGTGNLTQCMQEARILLHNTGRNCYVPASDREFAVDPSKGACGINAEYEPNVHMRKFVAVGHYAKLASFIGIPTETLVELKDLLPGIYDTCYAEVGNGTLDVDDSDDFNLSSSIADAVDPMRLPLSRCWKLVWMWLVLHEGLKFPTDVPQIMFARTLNGKGTGWATGAMMHELNYYPWSGNTGGAMALTEKLPIERSDSRSILNHSTPFSGQLDLGKHGFIFSLALLLGGFVFGLWANSAQKRDGTTSSSISPLLPS